MLIFLLNPFVSELFNLLHTGWSVSQILATNVLMDTTTNQVISRSLVCVWVSGIAFPPNWTTLPHGQHMYTWSPASWKSGQPSTTRLCHTLDNHPDNDPLAGQKHIKLPALTSVGILGNDYYWIDGKGSIGVAYVCLNTVRPGMGVTQLYFVPLLCHFFQNYGNIGCQFYILFIFDRCRDTVKYEHDSVD